MRNRRNAKERIAGEIFPNTNARCSTSWFVWQVTASASKKAKASAREWASRTFKRRHVRFLLWFFFFFFLYINEKSNRSLASFSPLLKRRIFSRNEINITKYQLWAKRQSHFPHCFDTRLFIENYFTTFTFVTTKYSFSSNLFLGYA